LELQNVSNTVEMAASSSKMLQIARNMDDFVNPEKKTKQKNNILKQFRTQTLTI
jgi:hypothetical protein